MSSLYLHIPFCARKCPYCSFSSFPDCERIFKRYSDAIIKDITGIYNNSGNSEIKTLYMGGGTPTVLPVEQLCAVINSCRDTFGFTPEAEISIEANPGTIDFQILNQLRRHGVNRLSLGVQSFDNNDLRVLGRMYRLEQIFQAFEDARKAGFENISLDLMYGLPDQDAAEWQNNLLSARRLNPEHLSLYQLTIEEDTPFHLWFAQGRISLPDEDLQLEMDEITRQFCLDTGFIHYEISNFCRPGYECQHNLVYWRNEEHMAAGSGSVGYCNGIRSRKISNPFDYCEALEAGRTVVEKSEKLDRDASFREGVVVGLRLVEGVEERRFLERFGCGFFDVYGSVLDDLASKGLIEVGSGVLRLTPLGRQLANVVMADLV